MWLDLCYIRQRVDEEHHIIPSLKKCYVALQLLSTNTIIYLTTGNHVEGNNWQWLAIMTFLIYLYVNPKQFFLSTAFTCSKLTIETLEQGVKYVQS